MEIGGSQRLLCGTWYPEISISVFGAQLGGGWSNRRICTCIERCSANRLTEISKPYHLRSIALSAFMGSNQRHAGNVILLECSSACCVQVQQEESVLFDLYEETARSILQGHIEALPTLELEAAWLQTDAGLV